MLPVVFVVVLLLAGFTSSAQLILPLAVITRINNEVLKGQDHILGLFARMLILLDLLQDIVLKVHSLLLLSSPHDLIIFRFRPKVRLIMLPPLILILCFDQMLELQLLIKYLPHLLLLPLLLLPLQFTRPLQLELRVQYVLIRVLQERRVLLHLLIVSHKCLCHYSLDARIIVVDNEFVSKVVPVIEKGLNCDLLGVRWASCLLLLGFILETRHLDGRVVMIVISRSGQGLG